MPNLVKQKNAAGKLMEFGMVRHAVDNMYHRNPDEGERRLKFQGQGKILVALSQNDGISQKELATNLNLTAQSTAEFVNKLVAKKLVTKEKSTTDRRMTVIKLTKKGREIANKESSKVPEFLNVLSDEELDQFSNILTKLNTSLYEEINENDSNVFKKTQKTIKEHFRDWFM
ncbi:MarR family winged helix-turn-helix transcriptional regulator [Companilactobacillus nodensis]|uniref:Transcriptional regulator n=1 Tax=Companilactobacillus nodensis DSM 19682 = JCM 14932 = NBRC 107160 TaxID=1423775 RepID=A0A0R1KGX2_9LACO|nr:MarR family transcriptional regulator [Companilactobacillus nodensis]KRK80153.1 transcriptional regulator [Companilactobacillus nodensis DSM 19682 = JCM 14932 = NBRC 107160]